MTAALFFSEMRYDPRSPQNPDNDRFVLSKGHAAPMLYAAWAEAGIISRDDLLKLRRFDSDLEGHPTPRLPWVDVATGSLGQGICAASRHRVERAAHHTPTTAPMCCSATVRSPKARCGKRRTPRSTRTSTRCAGSSTSTALGQKRAVAVESRHRRLRRRVAGIRLARHRHRRPRHGRDPLGVRRSALDARPADDDRREDDQGEGHLVHRREARLARQAAQEGRGSR